jgi:hypothetical protein
LPKEFFYRNEKEKETESRNEVRDYWKFDTNLKQN